MGSVCSPPEICTSPFGNLMICGTTPNMIEFTAPKCQFSDISYGDRSGLETSSISFACVKDDTLADNDFSIYFR